MAKKRNYKTFSKKKFKRKGNKKKSLKKRTKKRLITGSGLGKLNVPSSMKHYPSRGLKIEDRLPRTILKQQLLDKEQIKNRINQLEEDAIEELFRIPNIQDLNNKDMRRKLQRIYMDLLLNFMEEIQKIDKSKKNNNLEYAFYRLENICRENISLDNCRIVGKGLKIYIEKKVTLVFKKNKRI